MAADHGQQLVTFLHGLTLGRVPEDAVAMAESCLLDALGCGLFGAGLPWSDILAAEMAADGGREEATVLGRPLRLTAPTAALCNGTAIHGYELDDVIAPSVSHPAGAVIPAALAAAEATGASGERVVLGIIAGYETMHRLGLAMGVQPARRGFHTTALTGPAAAAVAAGIVMGLDQGKLHSAVGIACSAASGIKSFAAGRGGGMVKRLHLGRAAEAGLRAARLAERGFSGPPAAMDSRFGMLEVYGGEGADAARLTAGLGTDWAINEVWFKVYPICGWIQSAVQLLTEMRGTTPLSGAADVASVRVGVSSYAARNNGEPAPIDTMGAQYSIPYCAAVALTGEARDPRLFANEKVNDPAMRALAAKVEVFVDPDIEAVYPQKMGASVTLTLADGTTATRSVLDCHGTPEDPCSPAELREKFRILATTRISAEAADAIADLVFGLHARSSVTELASLFGGSKENTKSAVREAVR